jgi:hypothetical protein
VSERKRKWLVLSVFAFGAILFVAVGFSVKDRWRTTQHPPSSPFVVGRTLTVEGQPHPTFFVEDPRYDGVRVHTGPETRIRTTNGEAVTLVVGQKVSVWTTGIVMETSPPQVRAVCVIVEAEEQQAQP